MKDKKQLFTNPPPVYGSLSFWAWNDQMDEEEISFQIKEMANQGVGGFFMHSRDGLETEYLGTQWMSCVKRAVKEASGYGMTSWLYDEDRWPSGTAGGRVTSEGDKYRCKGLTLEICQPMDTAYLGEGNVMAVYGAIFKEMDIYSIRRLSVHEECELMEGESRLVIRLEVSGGSEWFNGEAPPDNLNPDTVRCFIQHTHEKYAAEVGKYFGSVIPGIFTDEPSLADRHANFPPNRSWIPWTYGFENYYRDKRDRDIFDTIPYIYFDGSLSPKARHDYWNTISELFCESYSQVLAEWCRNHGIAYTGHFLQEDKLGLCARVNGSIMPHYKYMDIPGIDLLGEATAEYMTVKQCTSVAHQFGKKKVLTETYGCTGWDFSFEGMKWIGDWQFVLGVTVRSEHLGLYTLRGLRKRDYPPSFHYHNSWWDKKHVIEQYFARLSMMLQEGEPVRRILILHPMSTAWSRLGASPYGNPVRNQERDVPKINDYGNEFNSFLEFMSRQHYDYDLGDEIIMATDGKIHNDKLYIGNAEYSVVIIPPVDTMKKSTLRLLGRYLDAGGKIILKTPVPNLVEGEACEDLRGLLSHPNAIKAADNKEILEKLENMELRDIHIKDRFGLEEQKLLYQYRINENGGSLFVVNNDRVNGSQVAITIPEVGNIEEWNLLTGEIVKQPADIGFRESKSSRKAFMEFISEFKPCESKLYVWVRTENKKWSDAIHADNKIGLKAPLNSFAHKKKKLYKILPKQTKVSLTMDNVLTLDKCRWRFSGGQWSDTMEVWRAQHEIRTYLNMRQIHNNGLEQRYRWIGKAHPKDGTDIELSFMFFSNTSGIEHATLVVERAAEFDYIINGSKVAGSVRGWYLDKSFQKIIDFPVQKGMNEIIMSCAYKNDFELEASYVIGDFGVAKERELEEPVKDLYIGDWTVQGLLHYPGSVVYHYEFFMQQNCGMKNWLLEVPAFFGTCMAARLNGKEYDMPWPAAAEVDISKAVQGGMNYLEIEIYSSPRNMLGPFHTIDSKRRITNDACFTPKPDEYYDDYQVVPCGLNIPPHIYGTQFSK